MCTGGAILGLILAKPLVTATLEDVRAEVLTPERLNTFVFSALGGIVLLIAVVGVAGVLAFSVGAHA